MLLLSFFSSPMECDDAFFFVKEERCILFPFLRKRKEDGWHSLVSALEKFLSGRNEDVFLHGERREEKKGDLSVSFLFSEGRRKGMLCRFWRRRKRKMGKRKRGQISSLIPAFDTLSAAACDEEVVLIVRTVVDVMPPLTTCVVRGFPSFRDGTSIA